MKVVNSKKEMNLGVHLKLADQPTSQSSFGNQTSMAAFVTKRRAQLKY